MPPSTISLPWWVPRQRLPMAVEVVGSSVVAVLCLAYYYSTSFNNSNKSDKFPPLVTCCPRFPSVDNLDEIYQSICNETKSLSQDNNNQDWITAIRNSLTLRCNVQQFLQIYKCTEPQYQDLYNRLEQIYPELIPPPPTQPLTSYKYSIALIVPTYKEDPDRIVNTLQRALDTCCLDKKKLKIVVAQAGNSDDTLQSYLQSRLPGFTKLTVIHSTTTGRGPTQNAGAAHATDAAILTFLHADVMLPEKWDQKIIDALYNNTSNTIVQACAFHFGVNKDDLDPSLPFPWGIKAVIWLVNLRTHLCKLPYGDQVLSLPQTHFQYWGGFPNQPIMDDYELVDVLRRRPNEKLQIIPPPAALCSPRRWQKKGVLQTTLINSVIIHKYRTGKWNSNEIYELYYGKQNNKRD